MLLAETDRGKGALSMKNAIIAAVVAAVVAAASGTAATLVTSKTIKDGTIQLVDLSAAAKKGLKGARGVRGAAGVPGRQGTPGIQGPQGIQGPPGTPSFQRLRFSASPTVTIPKGTSTDPGTGRAEAACLAGEVAVSGGYGLIGAESGITRMNGNGSAWVAEAENSSLTDTAQLTAYAYCAPGVTFVP